MFRIYIINTKERTEKNKIVTCRLEQVDAYSEHCQVSEILNELSRLSREVFAIARLQIAIGSFCYHKITVANYPNSLISPQI